MICPRCNQELYKADWDSDHLEACGVVFIDRERPYGDQRSMRCICGTGFLTETLATGLEDYEHHLRTVKHDWPKIFTRLELESM